MKNGKPKMISLGDVAKAAGVSKASASFALQNRPGVSKATRERIKRLARRLGYTPDPRLAALLTTVRQTRAKGLLSIAWLNSHDEEDAWQKYQFLSPYLEGARARALDSGYRIEEMWIHRPGTTFEHLSQQLFRQGIEGVIVTHPARHLRLDWSHLACISLGGSLLAPRLHRVMPDHSFNLLLAVKATRRLGYKRIGICLGEDVDRASAHSCRAAALHIHATTSKSVQIKPLFYQWGSKAEAKIGKAQALAWVQAHRPEVVIGHSNHWLSWAEEIGYRVPEDLGIVHIATDDDVSDWAGVASKRRDMGAAAAEWVINLVKERRFGVPVTAMDMVVRGSWHLGHTVRIPTWLNRAKVGPKPLVEQRPPSVGSISTR